MSRGNLRFAPRLESLGERLNLSTLVPTAQAEAAYLPSRFILVESVRPDESMSQIVPTGTVVFTVDGAASPSDQPLIWFSEGPAPAEAGTILEGHECLVFYLGGIPSSDAAPKYWVFGTEVPQDRVGPFFEFKGSGLSTSDAESQVESKTLVALSFPQPDDASGFRDDLVGWDFVFSAIQTSDPYSFTRDGRASGM